jgi:hypothetical protein
MLVQKKKTAAIGIALGVLLIGGTAAQASAQATQDTSTAATQDTAAYSAPERSDTSAPPGVTDSSVTSGTDSSMSKMGGDSAWTDSSKSDKAWKKNEKESADSTK